MKTALMAMLIAVIGCGGAARPDPALDPLDSARDGQKHDTRAASQRAVEREEGEPAAMPPEIKKFHETLAPRWHAAHGPQRLADTCAAVPQFRADAEAIAKAAPPAGANATAWSDGAKQLGDAVNALEEACGASDAARFEQAFTLVHEQFHAVLGSLGESPEGHGGEHGGARHER